MTWVRPERILRRLLMLWKSKTYAFSVLCWEESPSSFSSWASLWFFTTMSSLQQCSGLQSKQAIPSWDQLSSFVIFCLRWVYAYRFTDKMKSITCIFSNLMIDKELVSTVSGEWPLFFFLSGPCPFALTLWKLSCKQRNISQVTVHLRMMDRSILKSKIG